MSEVVEREISEFMHRYVSSIEEVVALEEQLRKPTTYERWQQLLRDRADRYHQLFERNEQDLKRNVYSFLSGERALTDEVAVAYVHELFHMTDIGVRDTLTDHLLAQKLAEYAFSQDGDDDLFVLASFIYAYHLCRYFYIRDAERLDLVQQELHEVPKWYERILSRCGDMRTLRTEQARRFILAARANLVISQNIANPDCTGDRALQYLCEMGAFLREKGLDAEGSGPAMYAVAETTLLSSVLLYNIPSSEPTRAWARARAEALYREALEKSPDEEVDYILECLHTRLSGADDAFSILYRRFEQMADIVKRTPVLEDIAQLSAMFDLAYYSLDALFKGTDSDEEKRAMSEKVVHIVLDAMRTAPERVGLSTQDEYIWANVQRIMGLPLAPELKRHLLLSLSVYRQISTSIHVRMVALVVDAILEAILDRHPDMLVGVWGMRSAEEVRARREEIAHYGHECALYHDVGKIRISDTIALQYRRLTDYEFQEIQMHPVLGANLLRIDPSLRPYADVALGHHKTYDGTGGYPRWFDHRRSPYAFFIDLLSVADSVDAATDNIGRNYRYAKTFEQVYRELVAGSGRRYSPKIVQVLEADADLRAQLSRIVRDERTSVCYHVYQTFLK